MSHTPSGTANKIKSLSRPPSVQKRGHNASIHQSDLERLAAAGALQSASSNKMAVAGQRSSRGEEVQSKKRPTPTPSPSPSPPPSRKTGGLIKHTGVYTLHKGEVVVPAHRVKTVDMALKKDKKVPLKK